jgi:hypothetical protein
MYACVLPCVALAQNILKLYCIRIIVRHYERTQQLKATLSKQRNENDITNKIKM